MNATTTRKRRRSEIHARKLRRLIGRRAERRFVARIRAAELEG